MTIREKRVKSILNKSKLGMYTANPYSGCDHACKYCYVRGMHDNMCHDEDWGEFIDVKYWPELPTYMEPGRVFLSTVTDPYNTLEYDYCRTKVLLEQMITRRLDPLIVTKSDLVLRDFDLLLKFNNPIVCFSLNSLDEDFVRDMESAASVAQRLDAMRMLHDCGIRVGSFIAPIFPGITRPGRIIEEVRDKCDFVVLDPLNLRCENKTTILQYVATNYKDLLPVYNDIYTRGNTKRWFSMLEATKRYAAEHGLRYVSSGIPESGPFTVVGFTHWR